MPNGQIIKYDLPAIYVENYTTDVIFQKKLLFLLPFYIMRYEKSREKLDKNPKELRELLQEYEKIAGKLEDSLLGRGREAQHRYLVEVIIRISDYIFANSEKTRKGVNAAMGGEVLDLKTDKLINEIRQDVKEEVRDEVKMEIVVYMLKKGINTLEEIADSTNLSLEQVKKIKEEQKL